MKKVKTQLMSLLQAYLRTPRAQRALSLKPGEKGFSLIELVVVVAVLAILAAIAVPAYLGMQEQAADAAARTNLKNAYKECAYQEARGIAANGNPITAINPATYDFPQNDQFYTYTDSAATDGECITSTTTTTGTGANATTSTTTGFTLVTATKGQGANQGTLVINVGDGTRTGTSTW